MLNMQFDDYQTKSRQTAQYPDAGDNFVYPALGLVGEAGEVADKLKKLMRDQGHFRPSEVTPEMKAEIMKELGDVLWYVAQLATEFSESLDTVATTNLEKVLSRQARNQVSGSGDNR